MLPALLGLAGCGDNDQEASGDVVTFCDAYISMVQASDSEKELASLSDKAEALVAEVEASVPGVVAEPLGVVVDATRRAAAEGTPEAFMSREVTEAQNDVLSYMFDHCELEERLDVTGNEYAFEGVPDTVSAGLVALRFTNDGEEPHEIIVFRKNDGVTESFDEILKLPEGARRDRITFVSAVSVVEPGESQRTIFEAEAGEYIAVCFLRVGPAPPEESDGPLGEGEGPSEEESEGPSHWVEGQRSELTVE